MRPPPHPHARYIWTDDHGSGRNRFVCFRKTFTIDGRATHAVLNLFADTRYRLMVNGQTVGHGPGRFFPWAPAFDTHDLTTLLQPGRNVIAALVNSVGTESFQGHPSIGGLIAWGEVATAGGTVALVSDGSWKAIEAPGYVRSTPKLSFALGPGEVVDLRELPDDWAQPAYDDGQWPAAVAIGRQDHWGPLEPRSIERLDESVVRPAVRRVYVGRRERDEVDYSCVLDLPAETARGRKRSWIVLTHVHSPREQEVAIGSWWGRHIVNGQELAATNKRMLRQDFVAKLRAGWNTLQVIEEMRFDFMDVLLSFPREAGVTLSATKVNGSPEVFAAAGPVDAAVGDVKAVASLDELRGMPGFRYLGGGGQIAYRERALLTFEPAADEKPRGERAVAYLFDFGTEVLGRPRVTFTAQAGTTVDCSYTERLLPNGAADVHFRHFQQLVDRCVARDGRQTWHAFHPRGFRYLEVLASGELDGFELHDVEITNALYPMQPIGRFECSDERLTRLWRMCRDTSAACAEDAHLDCPGRERGVYTGDVLVEMMLAYTSFGDTSLARRSIELFLQSQGENGLVAGGAFGLPPGRHPDYSAIELLCAWEYYALSGDAETIRGWMPRLVKVCEGLVALSDETGALIDGSEHHHFIDHATFVDRRGVNCPVNAFCVGAFAAMGRLAGVVGDAAAQRRWGQEAVHLAQYVRDAFWNESAGVFVDRQRKDEPDTKPSVHGNALCVLFDIATDAQKRRVLPWLVEATRQCVRDVPGKDRPETVLNAYFSYYLLEAFYRNGMGDEALRFISREWSRMLDGGAWTCWEYFADEPGASRCHAWSGCPGYFLSTRVLGVRAVTPGDLTKVRVAPEPSGLSWARGVVPHPRGPIEVEWRRAGEEIELDVRVPAGVEWVK